jgi:hypothetical protein
MGGTAGGGFFVSGRDEKGKRGLRQAFSPSVVGVMLGTRDPEVLA